jgi:hypothetical protein
LDCKTADQGGSEAAAPFSPAGGTDLFLLFDKTGPVTGVAFANPGEHDAAVSGSFLETPDVWPLPSLFVGRGER